MEIQDLLPLELKVLLPFQVEGLRPPTNVFLCFPFLQGRSPCQLSQGLDKYSNRKLKPYREKSWPRLFKTFFLIFRTKESGKNGNKKISTKTLSFFFEATFLTFLFILQRERVMVKKVRKKLGCVVSLSELINRSQIDQGVMLKCYSSLMFYVC